MWRGPIGTYYFLTILRTCGITACTAVYASFLLSKGLNLFEINLINVAFFVTLFLCEVPTGAFADVFGRKTSVVLSCGVFTLGMLIYAASDGFWGFIVAEILAAIAATLVSGAFDAWLVDSLKHQGSDRPLRPIFARATQIRHGSGLLAALLGAIIADYSIELPWILGACFFALAGIAAALLMKEEYFERRAFSIPSGIEALKDTLSASVEFGIRNLPRLASSSRQWRLICSGSRTSNSGYQPSRVSVSCMLPWLSVLCSARLLLPDSLG